VQARVGEGAGLGGAGEAVGGAVLGEHGIAELVGGQRQQDDDHEHRQQDGALPLRS
jgi:hypothetical protein